MPLFQFAIDTTLLQGMKGQTQALYRHADIDCSFSDLSIYLNPSIKY